jgi:hypothetical protein
MDTNFSEERASVCRVEDLRKKVNCRFLTKVGISRPNYTASHLYVTFLSLDVAHTHSMIPIQYIPHYKEETIALNLINERLHALAKSLGSKRWAKKRILGML